jgi:hypothetical protein
MLRGDGGETFHTTNLWLHAIDDNAFRGDMTNLLTVHIATSVDGLATMHARINRLNAVSLSELREVTKVVADI